MKLILSIFLSIGSIVLADTINSITKNPSMAVLGTQRDSTTTIQPWVLPVAVSGAACNSATDTVAITSDHSSQLVCQSGVWKTIGGKPDQDEYIYKTCGGTVTTTCTPVCPAGRTLVSNIHISSYVYWTGVGLCKKN